MKFICRSCESYMSFETVEPIREGQLGVSFVCPSCKGRFSMITNAGETQLVSTLGVELGGRSQARQPLEMTRQSLGPAARSFEGAQSSAGTDSGVNGAQGASASAGDGQQGTGTASRCPFAGMVAGLTAGQSTGESAQGEIPWSPEAKQRLQNLPEFLRPMAQREIEQLAQSRGEAIVTGEVMDLVRERYMHATS